MTESSDNRGKTGEKLTHRRVDINPEYRNLSEFARATGINYKTLQRIESGADHRFSRGTLLALDQAYRYPPGTIEHMLATGEEPPLVPRGTRPPIESDEPGLRIVETPPLERGELLEGWPIDEGRTHYHYRDSRDADTPLDIRMIMDSSTPLEDVVKRMRAMAAIGRM